MTMTRISSSSVLSKVAPKMMLASGWAASCTRFAAASTSSRPMSSLPVTVYEHAVRAVYARLHERAGHGHLGGLLGLALADAWPTPMWAKPASFIIVVTSAKSRLMKPVFFMRSEMLVTGWRRTSSAISKAFASVTFWSVAYLRRSLGIISRLSTLPSRAWMAGLGLVHAALALELEGLRHNAYGQRAGLAGNFRHDGGRARAGAAAHAGGDEHHVGVFNALGDVVAALLGALLARIGIGARALAVGELFAYLDFLVGVGDGKRLLVRVDGDELHALGAGLDHTVDDVVAGAAHAEDLQSDHVFRPGFGFVRHIRCLPHII